MKNEGRGAAGEMKAYRKPEEERRNKIFSGSEADPLSLLPPSPLPLSPLAPFQAEALHGGPPRPTLTFQGIQC